MKHPPVFQAGVFVCVGSRAVRISPLPFFYCKSSPVKQKTCLRSKQDIFVRNNYCTLLTFLASLDFLRAAAFLEITPS